jgi:predicted RNA-binding protein with RPS1 domain
VQVIRRATAIRTQLPACSHTAQYFGLAIPDSAPQAVDDETYCRQQQQGGAVGDKRKRAGDTPSYGDSNSAASMFPYRAGPTPSVGDRREAEVKNIKDFGAFVEMRGYTGAAATAGGAAPARGGVEGLLHMSQIMKGRVADIASHLKRNQKVKVKIISIVGTKLSVSMKDVDQSTGADLKPARGGADDLHASPARPSGLSDPSALRARLADDEREVIAAGRSKRLSSPERWEMKQLLSSGAMLQRDRPNIDEGSGIIAHHDDDEEDKKYKPSGNESSDSILGGPPRSGREYESDQGEDQPRGQSATRGTHPERVE